MTTTATSRRPAILESELERRFVRAIRSLLRGRTLKIAPTEKGAPDRLVLLPGGRIQLVELKTATGRLSPAQKLWHDRAQMLGIDVAVIWGENGLEDWIAAQQCSN